MASKMQTLSSTRMLRKNQVVQLSIPEPPAKAEFSILPDEIQEMIFDYVFSDTSINFEYMRAKNKKTGKMCMTPKNVPVLAVSRKWHHIGLPSLVRHATFNLDDQADEHVFDRLPTWTFPRLTSLSIDATLIKIGTGDLEPLASIFRDCPNLTHVSIVNLTRKNLMPRRSEGKKLSVIRQRWEGYWEQIWRIEWLAVVMRAKGLREVVLEGEEDLEEWYEVVLMRLNEYVRGYLGRVWECERKKRG